MSGAGLALRRALVAALRADVELTGQLSGVFDAPPPGQAYPYLSFGPDVMSDAGHKTGEGRLHRLQLSLWDDRPDRRRLMELMSLVENALAALAGDIDGHRLVSFRLARSLVMRDPIGVDQGVMEFRATTFAA